MGDQEQPDSYRKKSQALNFDLDYDCIRNILTDTSERYTSLQIELWKDKISLPNPNLRKVTMANMNFYESSQLSFRHQKHDTTKINKTSGGSGLRRQHYAEVERRKKADLEVLTTKLELPIFSTAVYSKENKVELDGDYQNNYNNENSHKKRNAVDKLSKANKFHIPRQKENNPPPSKKRANIPKKNRANDLLLKVNYQSSSKKVSMSRRKSNIQPPKASLETSKKTRDTFDDTKKKGFRPKFQSSNRFNINHMIHDKNKSSGQGLLLSKNHDRSYWRFHSQKSNNVSMETITNDVSCDNIELENSQVTCNQNPTTTSNCDAIIERKRPAQNVDTSQSINFHIFAKIREIQNKIAERILALSLEIENDDDDVNCKNVATSQNFICNSEEKELPSTSVLINTQESDRPTLTSYEILKEKMTNALAHGSIFQEKPKITVPSYIYKKQKPIISNNDLLKEGASESIQPKECEKQVFDVKCLSVEECADYCTVISSLTYDHNLGKVCANDDENVTVKSTLIEKKSSENSEPSISHVQVKKILDRKNIYFKDSNKEKTHKSVSNKNFLIQQDSNSVTKTIQSPVSISDVSYLRINEFQHAKSQKEILLKKNPTFNGMENLDVQSCHNILNKDDSSRQTMEPDVKKDLEAGVEPSTELPLESINLIKTHYNDKGCIEKNDFEPSHKKHRSRSTDDKIDTDTIVNNVKKANREDLPRDDKNSQILRESHSEASLSSIDHLPQSRYNNITALINDGAPSPSTNLASSSSIDDKYTITIDSMITSPKSLSPKTAGSEYEYSFEEESLSSSSIEKSLHNFSPTTTTVQSMSNHPTKDGSMGKSGQNDLQSWIGTVDSTFFTKSTNKSPFRLLKSNRNSS